MEIVKILSIDYEKMGEAIAALRKTNVKLKKYVCFFKQIYDADTDLEPCEKSMQCDGCTDMLEASVSQEDLGRALGESKNVVASWETGRTSPDMQHILALCTICDLDMGEFIRASSLALNPE